MSVTVVVGATGALGVPVAQRLSDEGHALVLVARSQDAVADLAHSLGADAVAADVTSDDDVAKVAQHIQGKGLRMLVYLPAAPMTTNVLTADTAALTGAFDVKVNGLLRFIKALDAEFVPGTKIVVVSGTFAFDPSPMAASAGVANAAQVNLVRQLQRALGERGVTIHVVAPGPVMTQRWLSVAQAEAARRGVSVDVIKAEAAAANPTGELVTIEQVAWAVSILADPHASALAGSTLLLDGGRRTSIP